MVIRKRTIEEVRPFVGTDVVKVITGVRRCGKSVLLSQIRDLILSKIDKSAPSKRVGPFCICFTVYA